MRRFRFSAPKDYHLFEVESEPHLFLANGSRVFRITREATQVLADASILPPAILDLILDSLGIQKLTPPQVLRRGPASVRSLSLAITEYCNLDCSYCYLGGGNVSRPRQNMTIAMAMEAVNWVLSEAGNGEQVHLSFIGGEPLLNRGVLQAATQFAEEIAGHRGVQVAFGVTTNGTLLTPADADFFARHRFKVTISLDGLGPTHDRQRYFRGGHGSFERIVDNLKVLMPARDRIQIVARVTVTPANLALCETLDLLAEIGFERVFFAPLLSCPTGCGQLNKSHLITMLQQMLQCGDQYEHLVGEGIVYPFGNMTNALRQIHTASCEPLPCQAGVTYLALGPDGRLFVCHRFLGDQSQCVGNLECGVDSAQQTHWIAERTVDDQVPCRSCWARYLCGGGCHYEVAQRNRHVCAYTRGWYHYCLQAYARLMGKWPDFIHMLTGPRNAAKKPPRIRHRFRDGK